MDVHEDLRARLRQHFHVHRPLTSPSRAAHPYPTMLKLHADDIPLLLPPAEVGPAQASAVFKRLLEEMPLVGPFVGAINEARKTREAIERDTEISRAITSMWIVVKGLEQERVANNRSDGPDADTVITELRARAASLGTGPDVTLVLDSYLGLTATFYLPNRHVPSERIEGALIAAYIDTLSDQSTATEVINQANRIRSSMSDAEPPRVNPNSLGKVAIDPRNFWFNAFERARTSGSRMVASLLLAHDPIAFEPRAQDARTKLLDYLTSP